MDIKPANPTPPVVPARKIERHDRPQRDGTHKRGKREDRASREDDQPGIDTYA
jgi:hypothetical protein